MRGLEDVAVLSSLGTLGMLVAIGVAVGKLAAMEVPIKPTELIHKPSNITTPVVALLDIVFTYGGQVSFHSNTFSLTSSHMCIYSYLLASNWTTVLD